MKLSKIAFLVLLLIGVGGVAWAQQHDLEMDSAPGITAATNGTNWHSPDVKLGADFGDASVPDIVRRGADTPIFAKFDINGVQDFTITSPLQIYFHYREATVGETPPAITDPTWQSIGTLTVPYNPAEPFFITREWPTDFPSVATKSMSWTPPDTGDKFHVRAHVIYPGETPTTPAATSTDQQPDDNIAISLYESILGKRDIDLVIVHDVSGSMITNTYAGDTYLQHAKSRAQNFILQMTESHKLGIVAFGGCLPLDTEDIWRVPMPPLTEINGHKVDAIIAVQNDVTVASPSCMTPLGAGVQRAIQLLSAEPPSGSRKRTILLLSDGWENSGTPRACDGADPANPCLGESILNQLQTHDIRLFSIALGTAAGTECLECLANNSDGKWYAPPGPGIQLAQVYADMQQVYSADDLYRADTGISGSGTNSYATHFEGADDLLYFSLQTDRLRAELALELKPPNKKWMAAADVTGAKVYQDLGYFVVRVAEPATGDWGYRVVGEKREAYLVTVRSDRVATSLRMGLDTKGVVDSPIIIKAVLKHKDKPIDNADLVATVQVPIEASFQTRMQKASRQYIARTKKLPLNPEWREKAPDLSPRAQFLKTVGDNVGTKHPTKTIKVAMKHTDQGIYKGKLSELNKIAGEYKISVSYQGKKADRVWTESVRLQPAGLDPKHSFAELAPIKGRDQNLVWLLRVHPVDSFGNAIVSEKALSTIEAVIDEGNLVGKPAIVFDSAIQQKLDVRRDRLPVLKQVTIFGKEIRIRKYTDID